MSNVTEYLNRAKNNLITLTLTEAGSGISVSWTELTIEFLSMHRAVVLTLTRNVSENGIVLNTSTGVLTIDPGALTSAEQTALAALAARMYRCQVSVIDPSNPDGVTFGMPDSADKLFVQVT